MEDSLDEEVERAGGGSRSIVVDRVGWVLGVEIRSGCQSRCNWSVVMLEISVFPCSEALEVITRSRRINADLDVRCLPAERFGDRLRQRAHR